MHLGEISFCDRIAYNVKSDDFKSKILKDIESKYGICIIQKHSQRFSEEVMHVLNSNPHLVTVRSNGNPYYLYLTTYNFVPVCLFIDKKIQQNYFYPRMILYKMWFDNDLFNDTLFDGEMVKCKDGSWKFLVGDLIVESQKKLVNVNLVKRLEKLNYIFQSKYSHDECIPFSISVKQYYTYNDIRDLYEGIPKLPFSCRGIYFKPLFIKFRDVLLNFDDSLVKKVVREKYKSVSNFIVSKSELDPTGEYNMQQSEVVRTPGFHGQIEPKQEKMHQMKSTGGTIKVFQARKTAVPDIYELFEASDTSVHGAASHIACVSSMDTSKMLQAVFKMKNLIDRVPFVCKYSDKFKKWIPLHVHS
jgi:hypothetical protein